MKNPNKSVETVKSIRELREFAARLRPIPREPIETPLAKDDKQTAPSKD